MAALVEKVVRLTSFVDEDAELGVHCCYGDSGRKHFLEPPDTGMIATFLLRVTQKLNRPLNRVHFPMPKDRYDTAYFLPLKPLLEKLDARTEVFVGLVHSGDIEGTKRRIETTEEMFAG